MRFFAWIFLSIQGAIVLASLLGYGIFTSRPDWLAQVDPQARFFTWAFYGFAIGNMLFGGLAVLADALSEHPGTDGTSTGGEPADRRELAEVNSGAGISEPFLCDGLPHSAPERPVRRG